MTKKELYEKLKKEFREIVEKHNLGLDKIIITSRSLRPDEAIGITKRKDFPILNGKEVMLQAEYMGAFGQAFTDAPAVFSGTLEEILNLDLTEDDHAVGIFIASLNAVMKKLGLIEGTLHCKNDEPEKCAEEMVKYIKENYGEPRIALIGYQPALIDNLKDDFLLRVLDLNSENIGKMRYGIKIEHGIDDYKKVVLEWADLILCTGSTICNGTIVDYMEIDKEVLFFGTSVAGVAKILGLKRLCFESL